MGLVISDSDSNIAEPGLYVVHYPPACYRETSKLGHSLNSVQSHGGGEPLYVYMYGFPNNVLEQSSCGLQ